jgi:hypothetical protein
MDFSAVGCLSDNLEFKKRDFMCAIVVQNVVLKDLKMFYGL